MLFQDGGDNGGEGRITPRLVQAGSDKSTSLVLVLKEAFSKFDHEPEHDHGGCITGPAELLESIRVCIAKNSGHVAGIAPGLRNAGLKDQSPHALGMRCREGERRWRTTRRSYYRRAPLATTVEIVE